MSDDVEIANQKWLGNTGTTFGYHTEYDVFRVQEAKNQDYQCVKRCVFI